MKQLLLSSIICFFGTFLYSQSTTTWFPDSCEWAYTVASLGGPAIGYIRHDGFEMKGGEICVKLHDYGYPDPDFIFGPTWDEYRYVYHKNDSVFLWNEGAQSFKVLYDFTMQPGDTLQPLSSEVYDYAIVDSIGVIDWNDTLLKVQYLRLVIGANALVHHTRVVERVGGEHLVHWDIQTPVTEVQYYLACYRDEDFPNLLCIPDPAPPYYGFPSGIMFSSSTATWSESKTVWCETTGYQYHTEGDTVIWGIGQGKKLYYRKMYNHVAPCPNPSYEMQPGPWQLIGIIDQSITNKKVYYTHLGGGGNAFPYGLNDSFPDINETVLLYDFDLEVQDVVDWKHGPNIVAFIDSVQVDDGTWRQRYYFTDLTGQVDTSYYWIEGVGGSLGLFTSYINTQVTDVSNDLKCLKVQDTSLVYSTVDAIFCDSLPFSNVSTPKQSLDFSISPNPVENVFRIEIPEKHLPARVELRSVLGQSLLSFEANDSMEYVELTLSNRPNYVALEVIGKNGATGSKMLILNPID